MSADRTLSADPVRIAVVGLGRVFERFHLPALRQRDDARLAVWDQEAGRRAWARDALPGATVAADLTGLLEQRADALLLLTPPATHAALACRALGAGLHVFVEKPMALDPADAARMVEAATAADRRLQVGFTRRFRAPYRRLKERLAGVEPIAAAQFELRFPASAWGARDAFLGDDRAGGGVLDDVLSHQVDLLRWVLGASPTRVRVSGHGATAVRCDVEFPSGMVARCNAGHGSYREWLVVRGVQTAVAASGSGLVSGDRATRTWARWLASLQDRAALALARAAGTPNVTHQSFAAQLDDFLGAVRGRAAVGADGHDGLAAVNAIAACRRGIASGGWEPVSQPGR